MVVATDGDRAAGARHQATRRKESHDAAGRTAVLEDREFSRSRAGAGCCGPRAAGGPIGGKVWLFTLGRAGGSSAGGAKVTEVGPFSRLVATTYLLRINEASGPPGSITPVHTHPGSEAFYVVAGETSSRTPHGVMRIGAGETATGHGADTPMQVSSSGSTDLHSLVMFVVDATSRFRRRPSFRECPDAEL